jgi:outer membrane protein OmpA-like peptidoglycan-associated protein
MSDHPLRIVPTPPKPPEPAAEAMSALTETPMSTPSSTPDVAATDQAKLTELRRLLLTPEQQQLADIQHRLNDRRGRVKDLSSLLPDAVNTRNRQDEALTAALRHNIGPALKQAIKHDPTAVIEAVTPVIGPAIRQAITKALNEFVQSIDETMKHSVSVQGLKWRFEALKTGRSFAEVVMYRTLLYRVEQAFLFHKKTGLLLQHVAAPTVASKDADMISGLLTAINDFAHDSFHATDEQNLMKLDYGDLEVWIEGGTPPVELAYIAVVINGNAPEGLRTEVLLPALEAIHSKLREALLAFEGDTSPFDASRPHLEDCLQAQYRGKSPVTEQPKGLRLPPSVAVPLMLLIVLLGVWGFFNWRAQRRWDAYLKALQTIPGVLVTEQRHTALNLFGPRFYIEGLRDPLANDPTVLLPAHNLKSTEVLSTWKPYHALDPALVLARAHRVLEPPASIKLEMENGVLKLSGEASQQWVETARRLSRALPGITRLDESGLLTAEAREQFKLQEEIEFASLYFNTGTAQLAPQQAATLQKLTQQTKRLFALSAITGKQLKLDISGHTDTEGSADFNQRLSQERADYIANALASNGIDRTRLHAIGMATKVPLRAEQSKEDKQLNRRVSVQIAWQN